MKLIQLTSTLAGLGLQALAYLDAQDPSRRDAGRTAAAPANPSSDVVSFLLEGGGAPTLAKVATVLYAMRGLLSPSHPARVALRYLKGTRKASTVGRVASNLTLLAGGAALGAGVALLIAPRSGAKSRALVRQRIETLRASIAHATGWDEEEEEADEEPKTPPKALARRRAVAR